MMKKNHEIAWRISLGLLLISWISIAVYFSQSFPNSLFFATSISLITCVALKEYYQLTMRKGASPKIRLGLIFTLLYPFLSLIDHTFEWMTLYSATACFIFFLLLFANLLIWQNQPIISSATTLFGLFYITIPINFSIKIAGFFPINSIDDGRVWLAFVLIVTKMTDIGALLIGRFYGKNSFFPTISPKKTWEGAIGGLITANISSLIFLIVLKTVSPSVPFNLSAFQSVLLASVIGVAAQFGDLVESLLKRDAQIKDSGNIPGLGGMLDIIDSLIFTIPIMYFYLKILHPTIH